MIPPLRIVAILMLLAGLALGVFASRALRAVGSNVLLVDPPRGTGSRIELLVDEYRQAFRLDQGQADRVRRELQRYDRSVAGLIWELRQSHADRFRTLFEECSQHIRTILDEGR